MYFLNPSWSKSSPSNVPDLKVSLPYPTIQTLSQARQQVIHVQTIRFPNCTALCSLTRVYTTCRSLAKIDKNTIYVNTVQRLRGGSNKYLPLTRKRPSAIGVIRLSSEMSRVFRLFYFYFEKPERERGKDGTRDRIGSSNSHWFNRQSAPRPLRRTGKRVEKL